MQMEIDHDIHSLTKNHFIQQAELFGSTFYFDEKLEFPNATIEVENLASFYEQIKNCQKCKLSKSRTKLVFGVGNEKANLMCVGEGPGHDEDKMGEPFVGAAGQLLDRILASVGFTRDEVYIANIVKCRPPGNRDPEEEEIEECLPFLKKQIDLIKPKIILALGKVAARTLLQKESTIARLRENTHTLGTIKVVVTYHPAALLRNPQLKRQTWEDVQKLRSLYDELVGDKPLTR